MIMKYGFIGMGHFYITDRVCNLFHKSKSMIYFVFGHDILNIVHVLIGGFVTCVERCSTSMRFLAGYAVPINLLRLMLFEQWIINGADGKYACFRHFILVALSASCGL